MRALAEESFSMVGVAAHADTSRAILSRLLCVVESTTAEHEPFSHIYFENLFPEDLYAEMMVQMPSPDRYKATTLTSIGAMMALAPVTCCRSRTEPEHYATGPAPGVA